MKTITREELIELVAEYDSIRTASMGSMKQGNAPATHAAIIYGISVIMYILVHVFLQDKPKK